MHRTIDSPSRPSSSNSDPRGRRQSKSSQTSQDVIQPPLYTFPTDQSHNGSRASSRHRDQPPPYAPSTSTMAEGENLLGLVGTGVSRHGRTTRRPRAHTASAADKRTRTSSDASSRNGDRDAGWPPPPSLNRMSTEFAQSRNNLLSADERTPLIGSQGGDRNENGRSPGNRSHRSISVTGTSYDPEALVTPRRPRPSSWKNMLRAPSQMNTPTLRVIDTPNGEAIVVTRPKKKKHPVVRYLSPLWSATHWMALVHLIFINLPLVRVDSYVEWVIPTR
jgi:hypothetical protein